MRIAAWIAAVLGTLVLALLGVCGAVDLLAGDPPWPMPRPAPDTAGPRFRVAVLGDAQKGIGNLANILDAAAKEKVDLILQTGDLVASNDEGHYRLAALTFRRSALRVPMAVVPGNHDVKGGPARFERILGPLEWTFRRGQVTFMVVNNAFGDPPDLARLEERVAAARDDAVVLAMHVPPFGVKGDVLPAFLPFVNWLEKSRVRYLLCGQIHDYIRHPIGRTVVIANGVGGDYESWQLGQKAVVTILEIDGTAIADRRIDLPPVHGIGANWEHLALGHVGEAYRARPWLCWPATALLAGLVAAAGRRLWRARPPGSPRKE